MDAGRDYGDRLTYAQAATVLGCHVSAVHKLVAKGQLTSRGRVAGALHRDQVEALATERAAAAAARPLRRRLAPADPRPDADHDWMSAPAAAEILGVTPRAVTARLRRDRLPGVQHRGRWWMQRQHVLLELTLRERRMARG